MKNVVILILVSLIVAATLKLSIVNAAPFSNEKTKNYGIGIILSEPVYNALASGFCALKLDDRGAIGDIKIPFTKNGYIVFEL